MAENGWLNGYLEAILDVGADRNGSGQKERGASMASIKNGSTKNKTEETLRSEKFVVHKEKEGKLFSPTSYFVEEVVNSFDESDLHRTWIKVVATRNSRERNNRLENMCWRIWHLARKKKQIDLDVAQKLVKRRLELEKGRFDAAEDLSELSEGEKEKGDVNPSDAHREVLSRINSDAQICSDEDKPRQLYIVLISMHGLVRGENMELGRDSDTGGQEYMFS